MPISGAEARRSLRLNNLSFRRDNQRFNPPSNLLLKSSIMISWSPRNGMIISMAWVGVAARWSATKSETRWSDSCPIAETMGTGDSRIASIIGSRLNDHRSSGLPPPRLTTTTDGERAYAALSALGRSE